MKKSILMCLIAVMMFCFMFSVPAVAETKPDMDCDLNSDSAHPRDIRQQNECANKTNRHGIFVNDTILKCTAECKRRFPFAPFSNRLGKRKGEAKCKTKLDKTNARMRSKGIAEMHFGIMYRYPLGKRIEYNRLDNWWVACIKDLPKAQYYMCEAECGY
jgi:hypothetical protein